MEFSLGRELDGYIHPVVLSMDDSLGNVYNFERLQDFFKIERERSTMKIYELEHRLQQCINLYSSLQKSVDQTYSRINEQNNIIDMGRYENLLHYTFKEIQWVKSSRLMTKTDSIVKDVERYENELSSLQSKTKSMDNEYNELLEDRIEAELHQITEKAALDHKQSMTMFDSLEQSLKKVEIQFEEQFQQLQSELDNSNSVCISILSTQIVAIEKQMSELSCSPSNPY